MIIFYLFINLLKYNVNVCIEIIFKHINTSDLKQCNVTLLLIICGPPHLQYISKSLLSVLSSLNRVWWSSSSEPGHSGQYDTVTFSPLRVTGFLPSVESSPLCSPVVHFIRVCFILTGKTHDP